MMSYDAFMGIVSHDHLVLDTRLQLSSNFYVVASMSSSSLSSVVSSLLRAQLGTSMPSSVTDEELDRHVAELIVKEAKQKADRYLQEGVRAYLPDNE